MNDIKKLIPMLAATVLLAAMAVPTVALCAGAFDKEEGESAVTTTNKGATTTVPPTANTVPTTDDGSSDGTDKGPSYYTSLRYAVRTSQIEGLITDRTAVSIADRKQAYNNTTAGIENYDENAHTIVATDDYVIGTTKLALGTSIDADYSYGTEYITVYDKVVSFNDASYTTYATPTLVDRPTVKPYMGYLLISDSEGNIFLHDKYGNRLYDAAIAYEPYYARDKYNRPVFTFEGNYFVFDEESISFTQINESTIRVGLYYDYPATPYADNGYEAVYDASNDCYRYYYSSTGKYRLSEYFLAFNFSENVAVIMLDTENTLRVISTSGKNQFYSNTWYYYDTETPGVQMAVGDFYRFPDTWGIESIGCAGYDNGWLRVRCVTISQRLIDRNKVIKDVTVLLDKKGNMFDIPDGYSLEGYSDGVLLLEKNGYYGYYSINGYWIAQPIYTYAQPFVQGIGVVGFADGTCGAIDTEGNIVLPFVFTRVSNVSSGVITAYCEGIGWQVYYLVNDNQE